LATVHTVAIMALEASPSEPSNNEMFSEKTFHTPNRLRKEPFSHKSDKGVNSNNCCPFALLMCVRSIVAAYIKVKMINDIIATVKPGGSMNVSVFLLNMFPIIIPMIAAINPKTPPTISEPVATNA